MRLGDGFYIPADEPVEVVRQPSLEDLRSEQLLVAIGALKDALVEMPRPEVHVEAPDLTAIVQAVTGLKPGATSEDIAGAVVRQIAPSVSQSDTNEVLGKLVSAMERLDFRMSGTGGGGGGVVLPNAFDISDRPTRALGVVTVEGGAGGGTDVSALAKETTLQNVFAAVDTLESLTGQLVTATQALLTNAQLRAAPLVTRSDLGMYTLDAGTGSATVTVAAGVRIGSVAVIAPTATAATVQIGAMPLVTIPAGQQVALNPQSGVAGMNVVVAGSASYVVETYA